MYIYFTNRTDDDLWNSIVKDVKSSAKYGIEGQWNARKASETVRQYKSKGGSYTGEEATIGNNKLKKWLKEDWKTSTGKPSIQRDADGNIKRVTRYLPSKAWDKLSPQEKGATNRAKNEGYNKGKQFIPNTKAAKAAGKNARDFNYMDS